MSTSVSGGTAIPATAPAAIPVWIDCDPGHDDAFALLLAAYSPEIEILGVSVVHGNDSVDHCALNAARFLWTCGVNGVPIYKGTASPIVREPKYCPEIHGTPGVEGVSGLCGYHFPDNIILKSDTHKIHEGQAVVKMVETIRNHIDPVTVVLTGAQTNLALAIKLFPDIKSHIRQVVFMGGAIGIGNTGMAAEFNIEIDPEAVHIVLSSGIPLVMVPLEVTHTVLLTDKILEYIRLISSLSTDDLNKFIKEEAGILIQPSSDKVREHPHVEYNEIERRISDLQLKSSSETAAESLSVVPRPSSSLALSSPSRFSECCYQLLTFFKSAYFNVFSFKSPPLHDPTTIFYLLSPSSFSTIDVFVQVELGTGKCAGRTLVDIHNLTKQKPNVKLCTSIDVSAFWVRVFHCLKLADKTSPLNVL